ncbi:hypothetical protein RND71_030822 [Anisodus tanguticus]|uniref:RBR-type E3 ubiquitin transferase n=1 Tax=Anisodus tanguticus TaxID=243964 RepID=A0AAE1RFX4_9SOLA|nr:hypothetical protein RND71_030822 [Anisodus tanguticus]
MEVDDDLRTLPESADFDPILAFQLQMQEAINASITINADNVIGSSNNNVTNHLFAEELSNYEQQVKDQQKAEAEMKKIEDDLNRRIHDQAFAKEIMSVPEVEWKETGDHLHRPYGEEGSSSGVTTQNGECFRVYVKGLMGEDVEEIVGVVVGKQLAGIGVAVCDPSGILVFEVSKALGKGAEKVLTDEVVELKALIEGLDVAVRGKLHPRKSNIAALVEQATSCLRKFPVCIPSLVTQNTVNLAIKLATDAIVSQVRGPADKSLRKSITETCTICLQDTDIDHMFLINGCLHYYCFSCMNKHVEAKLLQGMLPQCPHEICKSELKLDSCKKFLTPKLYDLMSERVKETTIPITEKIYCPNSKCSMLMSKAEVQISAHGGARTCTKCHLIFCINCRVPWHQNMTCFDYRRLNPYLCVEDAKLKSLATQSLWRQCVKCNHMVSLDEGCYHIYCRFLASSFPLTFLPNMVYTNSIRTLVKLHLSLDPPRGLGFEPGNGEIPGREPFPLNGPYVGESGLVTDLVLGCGHEFCYTCGAEWKNKKATCSCKIWDERNIIYANRRQPRRG